MKIFNEKKLTDLQKDFNNAFPYLKIEFFKLPHDEGADSDEQERLDSNLIVGQVRTSGKSKEWKIDENITVGSFEKTMSNFFGLHVQVYRKEHGKWLQTWTTDIWTLEEQNRRSQIMGNKDNLLGNE